MNRSRKILFVIVLLALLAAGSVYVIPNAGYAKFHISSVDVDIRASVAVLGGGLSTGAAIWFLSGLSGFTAAFKTAYRILTIGIIMFSLSLLQLPLCGVFQWWDTYYANSGLMILPFLVSIIMMYLGLWKFSKILKIKNRSTSWWFISAIALVFAVTSGLAIGRLAIFPWDGIEFYTATVGWGLVWLTFCSVVAWHIERTIGESYKDAMRWMAIALAGYAGATAHEFSINFFTWNNSLYFWWGFQMIPWVIAGVLYLEAARRFYLLTIPATANTTGEAAKISDRDYIDNIIQVAGLASRPQDIDPILDDLRLITATHDEPELRLSESERKQLISVYDRLEKYLLTDEPVRRFSQEEVRRHTRPAFRALLSPADPSRR